MYLEVTDGFLTNALRSSRRFCRFHGDTVFCRRRGGGEKKKKAFSLFWGRRRAMDLCRIGIDDLRSFSEALERCVVIKAPRQIPGEGRDDPATGGERLILGYTECISQIVNVTQHCNWAIMNTSEYVQKTLHETSCFVLNTRRLSPLTGPPPLI